MKISTYTNNSLQLQGRITAVKEYSEGKAANVTIAVDNGKDKNGNARDASFIQLKSFTPASYNAIKTGMKVRIFGHVAPSQYEKDGEPVYTQDLVADYIEFLESKAIVDAREAAKVAAEA
ncbi:hypothetical protein J6A31_05890 [bacterium]|nr:hypothetical protein [bacterium]